MVQTAWILPNVRALYPDTDDLQLDPVLHSSLCIRINELSNQIRRLCSTGSILSWMLIFGRCYTYG